MRNVLILALALFALPLYAQTPVEVDELPNVSALADNESNPTISRIGVMLFCWDGSAWDRCPGDATAGLLVNLGSNNDVTNGGTFVVQEDGALLTSSELIDDTVYVDDADWADGSSKHALVGVLYQSTPQTITDGDVGPLQGTTKGAAHASLRHPTTGTAIGHQVNQPLHVWIGDSVEVATVRDTGGSDSLNISIVKADGSQIGITGDALIVDGSAVTQPVSGTVTANLSATDNAVLDTIAGAVYAEDVAFQEADPGSLMMALRLATPADKSGADGDFEPLQMDNGRLWTSTTGTVTANLGATDNAVLDSIADGVQIEGQNSAVPIYCTSSAFLNMTTATTTQIIALSGGDDIYICGYSFQAGGTTTGNLVSGTGSNCATSQADIAPDYELTTQAGIVENAGGGNIVAQTDATADAVCVTNSAGVNLRIRVSYAQF